MQLLVVSYTPGSYLLHCLEAEEIPSVGSLIEAERVRGRVLSAELFTNVQGCEGAVIVDDLTVSQAAELWPATGAVRGAE
ncbi:hypothetical protein [Halomonas smyrnensis]|uniref:hypothetical protein n=1 Tax=Halomonas smyrnensis TaxID=720605 RepID=UPI0003131786|nr:hypothetical protein [Halomonas smyrnensis]